MFEWLRTMFRGGDVCGGVPGYFSLKGITVFVCMCVCARACVCLRVWGWE